MENINFNEPGWKYKIIQDYMLDYSEGAPILNEDEETASKVFSGAIRYAASVFVNRLSLGGAYRTTKDHKEILEALKNLCDIIGC